MPERPPEMLTRDRSIDPVFEPEEKLYRRIPPKFWGEPPFEMEVDAIDAANISVNRSKYGPAEWAIIDDELSIWGVVYFLVGKIPKSKQHQGNVNYQFSIMHVPEKQNYTHSEIWVHCDGNRIMTEAELDPEFSLIWRESLLNIAKIAIRPRETGGS
jgi:hypothetical protein